MLRFNKFSILNILIKRPIGKFFVLGFALPFLSIENSVCVCGCVAGTGFVGN